MLVGHCVPPSQLHPSPHLLQEATLSALLPSTLGACHPVTGWVQHTVVLCCFPVWHLLSAIARLFRWAPTSDLLLTQTRGKSLQPVLARKKQAVGNIPLLAPWKHANQNMPTICPHINATVALAFFSAKIHAFKLDQVQATNISLFPLHRLMVCRQLHGFKNVRPTFLFFRFFALGPYQRIDHLHTRRPTLRPHFSQMLAQLQNKPPRAQTSLLTLRLSVPRFQSNNISPSVPIFHCSDLFSLRERRSRSRLCYASASPQHILAINRRGIGSLFGIAVPQNSVRTTGTCP